MSSSLYPILPAKGLLGRNESFRAQKLLNVLSDSASLPNASCSPLATSRRGSVLDGRAKEPASTGSAEILIDGPGCDFAAVEIILDIPHLRTRKVPKQIGFGTLLSIAMATDYLQCHDAVEPYGHSWLHELTPRMRTKFSSSTKFWMFMAHALKMTISSSYAQNWPIKKGWVPSIVAACPCQRLSKAPTSSHYHLSVETINNTSS